MANSIIIRFQPKGDKDLINAIKKLALAQSKLEKNTEKVKKELQSLGLTSQLSTKYLRNVNKESDSLNRTFATLRSKLLLFSFAMSLGGRQLIAFAKQAAQVQGMGIAFNTLSGGTENASVAMDKLRKATDGTMSKFDLFQQANNAMILGVSKNSDEMAQMFDMAQRLGKALGVGTKRAVESLITGIGRQSRLMLDNIGIIVKSEEAYESYAAELKKNVSDLTDVEKKQAFLNATLEAGRDKLERIGKEPETAIDSFDRLNASWSNFSDNVGTATLDVFEPLMNALSGLLDFFDEDRIKSYGIAMAGVGTALLYVNRAAIGAAISVRGLQFAIMGTGVGIAVVLLGELINSFSRFKEEVEETQDSIENVTVRGFGRYSDAVSLAGNNTEELTRIHNRASDAYDELDKKINEHHFGLKDQIKIQQDLLDLGVYEEQLSSGMIYWNWLKGFFVEVPKGWEEQSKVAEKFQGKIIEWTEDVRTGTIKLAEDKQILEKIEDKIHQAKANRIIKEQALIPNLENEIALLELKTMWSGDQLAIEAALLKLDQEELDLTEAQKIAFYELIVIRQEMIAKLREETAAKRAATQAERDAQKVRDKQLSDAQSILDSMLTEEESILKQVELYEGLRDTVEEGSDEFLLFSEVLVGLSEKFALLEDKGEKLKTSLADSFKVDSILAFGDALESEIFRGLQEGTMTLRSFKDSFFAMMNQIVAKIIAEQAILMLVGFLTGGKGKVFELVTKSISGHEGGQVQGYATGGIISNPSMQTYQGGGGVDNVPALLQEGEFVMRRSAVDSIGLETLNRMNRTGQAGGVTVNFTGNVMSDDFIEEEAIPKIRKALRRGADLGIA